MKHLKPLFFILFMICLFPFNARANIRIAVASNFYKTMLDISQEFHKKTGIDIDVISQSSGILYQQIRMNAPYDMFFSANKLYIDKLKKSDRLINDSIYAYATGQLALYCPKCNNDLWHKLQNLKSKELNLNNSNQYIAVANPDFAPYGIATKQFLQSMGVYKSWIMSRHIITSNSISKTFFQTRTNSKIKFAFVSLSQIIATPDIGKNEYFKINSKYYTPLQQYCAIIKNSSKIKDSLLFSNFIKSDKIQKLIKKSGYS